MQIREMMKKFMTEHKNKIELLQWGIINGFTSIFYSAFIASFKQVYVPTRRIKVPPINSVKHILDKDSEYMKIISDIFIDKMKEILDKYWKPYLINCPELEIFNDENIELLKTVFDL